METIVLGGGCFWCVEASYQLIRGVRKVTPGYAGGTDHHPDYYRVASGVTGHAEVVQVVFDPTVISLLDVLDIFWAIHDPTTVGRQGNDVGSQYRSVILYTDAQQLPVIEQSVQAAAQLWPNPIVTEVKALETFYEAEPEHHNYFKNHPEQAYCQVIINPKLRKLKQKFAAKLA